MQALEGLALASQILIVLSTEHEANTCVGTRGGEQLLVENA